MPDGVMNAVPRHVERCAHALRERAVWDEYLRVTKACAGDLERYTRSEPLAWRRLRRDLSEVARRRRDAARPDAVPGGIDGLPVAS